MKTTTTARRLAALLLTGGIVLPAAAVPAGPAAATPAAPATAADAAGTDLGQVRPGQARFWDGLAFARNSTGPTPALSSAACGTAVQCHDYTVDVVTGGDALRVAVDQTRMCDVLDLEVLDPAGRVAARGTTDATEYAAPSDLRAVGVPYGEVDKVGGACGYSTELTVASPAPGRWTVRVIGARITDTTWRGRLKLERHVEKHGNGSAVVLPDLVSTPPFELSFTSPTGDASGCRPDEVRNYGAQRCLRFSVGPQNRGEGALDLRYASLEGVTEAGQVTQRVYTRDGAVSHEQAAGVFRYHREHGHYHYAGFGLLDLYRLEGTTMRKVAEGPKVGACTGPYGISVWEEFTAAPRGSAPHDCAVVSPASGAAIGLEPGWTDIYAWNLEGNYVEFGGQEDGRYVVVVGTDAANEVLESDDSNNVAYAVVDVAGSTVTLVERGFGTGPFDPHRRPADDRYPATPGA